MVRATDPSNWLALGLCALAACNADAGVAASSASLIDSPAFEADYPHGFDSRCVPGYECDAPAGIAVGDPGTQSRSISFGFRLAPTNDRNEPIALVGKGNYRSHDRGWRFFVEWDDARGEWALYFRVRTSGSAGGASVTKWLGDDDDALDRWFHVTGVIDRSRDQLRIYLDDQFNPQIGGGAGATTHELPVGEVIGSPEPLMIGWARGSQTVPWTVCPASGDTWVEDCSSLAYYSNDCAQSGHAFTAKERQHMRGYVDQVRIYDGVLSRSEVTEAHERWLGRSFEEVEIFRQDSDYCYRIPAVVQSPTGELFAFAERRHGFAFGERDGGVFAASPCDDAGDHDIVLRRSTDGGRSWGKTWLVVDAAALRAELMGPGENGYVAAMNPSPVFDENGRLLLFYNVTYNTDDVDGADCGGVCGNQEGRVKSTDAADLAAVHRIARRKVVMFPPTGSTVTAGFEQDMMPALEAALPTTLRWHAFGPGHAIRIDAAALDSPTLASTPEFDPTHDLLAVPVYHNYESGGAIVPGGTTVLYYDSTTSTALGLETTVHDSTACPAGRCTSSELQVAQLPGGSLLMSARRVSKTCDHRRRSMVLTPGATEWVDANDPALVDPVSHGSLLTDSSALPVVSSSSACHASEWKDSSGTECNLHRFRMRRNLTVRRRVEGSSEPTTPWATGRVVRHGSSGYSDLVALDANRIGLLYEAPRGDARGGWAPDATGFKRNWCDRVAQENAGLPVENGNAYYENGITFARFTTSWIDQGDDGFGAPSLCDEADFSVVEERACGIETCATAGTTACPDFTPTDTCSD